MRVKIKGMSDHSEFLKRINKTLYYGQPPSLPCLSLPVTEVSCSVWSMGQRGRSVKRLRAEDAARLTRGACVSPCTLVLALLYLERLRASNPDYLTDTEPSDLFLVSLMVGSKFLEDSGEDDEVLCSEWAESSGLNVDQLKKLEIEFLKAIDWRVYVGQESFEEALVWLEKQVALKQSQQRGFFTYTDLAVAADRGALIEAAAAASYLASLTVAYITGVLTLFASSLVITHACLSSLHNTPVTTTSVAPIHLNANISPNYIDLSSHLINTTLEEIFMTDVIEETSPYVNERIKCCDKWSRYEDVGHKPNMNWASFETWWSKTSVLNWLYQSSLIDPMQRWLERLNNISDFLGSEVVYNGEASKGIEKCAPSINSIGNSRDHFITQWLNLSKLSYLMVPVSDR